MKHLIGNIHGVCSTAGEGVKEGVVVVVDCLEGVMWLWGEGGDVRVVLGRDGSWEELLRNGKRISRGDEEEVEEGEEEKGVEFCKVKKRRFLAEDMFILIGTMREDGRGVFGDGVGGIVSHVRKVVKNRKKLEESWKKVGVAGEEDNGILIGLGNCGGKGVRRKLWNVLRSRREDARVVKKEVVGGDPLNSKSDFGYRNLGGFMGQDAKVVGKDVNGTKESDKAKHVEVGKGPIVHLKGSIKKTSAEHSGSKRTEKHTDMMKTAKDEGATLNRRNTDVGLRSERISNIVSNNEGSDDDEGQVKRKQSFMARKGFLLGRGMLPAKLPGKTWMQRNDKGSPTSATRSTFANARESTAGAPVARKSEATPRSTANNKGRRGFLKSSTFRKTTAGNLASEKNATDALDDGKMQMRSRAQSVATKEKEGKRKTLPRAATLLFRKRKR